MHLAALLMGPLLVCGSFWGSSHGQVPLPARIPGRAAAQTWGLWQHLRGESQTITNPENNSCKPSTTEPFCVGGVIGIVSMGFVFFHPGTWVMVTGRMLPVSTKDLWQKASIPVARVLLAAQVYRWGWDIFWLQVVVRTEWRSVFIQPFSHSAPV